MSPARVLRGFILGGAGGLLGWLLAEFLPAPFPSPPFRVYLWEHTGGVVPLIAPESNGLLGLVLGLCIGGMLGIAEGVSEGTQARFRRTVLAFLALGALGGFLGLYFGQILYGALGGNPNLPESAAAFFHQIIARSLGWMLIGIFLGAVFGAPGLSARRAWNGAIGGGIGGLLGGFFFQTLTTSGLLVGMQGRLVGFVMLGAAIGFFINLVAEALKRVWVKVLVGRNEGREHVLDTPIAYVGRDELAEVPVFLDPTLPRRVASFRATGGRYALHPETPDIPIRVNGQPLVAGQVLRDGDAIQFGRVTLGYFEKATATGRARPVDRVPLAEVGPHAVLTDAAPIPTAAGVCEYCGHPRDPATGACLCTVPEGPLPGPAPSPAYAPAAAASPAYGISGTGAATVLLPGPGVAPAAVGGPALIVLSGPYAGQAFPLPGPEVTLGRDPQQQIPLTQDQTASRRHARLYWTGTAWVVRDEGSANGTWVNGVRVSEQPLYPGDVLRIGTTELRFDG